MHCDRGEGWEKEQEPEAIPCQWDMKQGVSGTCLPQIGSARTLVPGSSPSPQTGQEGEPFPDTGKKNGGEKKYEKRRLVSRAKCGRKRQSERVRGTQPQAERRRLHTLETVCR